MSRLRCPGCGVPTIEDCNEDTKEDELYCNQCEGDMNKPIKSGGATHTPGPWIVDPNPDLPLGVIMDTEDGLGICELEGNDDESRANAHLIAAAPAMYEVLREIVEAVGSGEVGDYSSTGDWYTEARAALAQAEGRHAT